MNDKQYQYAVHRICIFEFNNGTFIRAAIPDQDDFDAYLRVAKELCWAGDETIGRGRLRKFEVGDYIQVCLSMETINNIVGRFSK